MSAAKTIAGLAAAQPPPLLDVAGLSVALPSVDGPVRVVRDVSFRLGRGEILGIVGESGCGKSMTALALMGLAPDGATVSGRVALHGEDLLALDEPAMCAVRGNVMSMVFQEPMTSLNPVQTVGVQVAEPLRVHRGLSHRASHTAVFGLLARVGLEPAERFARAYPHQLSGGQRQRATIAMALACEPDVVIADEPTTALDVTVQGQILDLLLDLVAERDMALVLISHDLGVIAETVDRVAVMYGGRIVEEGPTASVFGVLAHPYTRGLFGAVPRVEAARAGRRRLPSIPGSVPEFGALPPGCPFSSRCAYADNHCRASVPSDVEIGRGHRVACLHLDAARGPTPASMDLAP
jgi:peptide/nickel transport system ATP-binding protein